MQIDHSEFQDQLVRGLAHRMNNILTLFHGYVGLMLDNGKLDKPTTDGLKKIQDGARAATELMDRTHSLVRPTTVVWREIHLGEFVQLLRPGFESFRGAKTNIELEVEQDLPNIWGDMSRVKAAIIELVRNACDAAGSGGTVTISIHGDEPAPNVSCAAQPIRWVCLKVTDDGPGVPTELDEKIYAPFFSTKKMKNSAGLGLAVAQGSVQQLGGLIRHRSVPGRTTFEMLLPSRGA